MFQSMLLSPAVADEESASAESATARTVTAVALLGLPAVQLASASQPAVRVTAAAFALVYQVRLA